MKVEILTEEPSESRRSLNIAMVCDFFYPRLGGVEMHISSLAQCLAKLGHKLVVITHAHGGRSGVRYLPGPVKVYYCPFQTMIDGVTLPTFIATYPLIRHIFVREKIDIVHGHQATSPMSNEALVYGSILGLATVYTDHSLFGLGDDWASCILNKLLKCTLSTVDAFIAVSHTCRSNLILRAHLDPQTIVAIPNAVHATKFEPPQQLLTKGDRVKVVVLSRLVYRKGVDLLLEVIPRVCQKFPQVDFIIGGNGNKKADLESMVHHNCLEARVEFLGAVASDQVRNVLCRGDLFINCSLTESFCIALLEAASTGMIVVSTDVGGVHEVLPCTEANDNIMLLAEPNAESLTEAVFEALDKHLLPEIVNLTPQQRIALKWQRHNRVAQMYSWDRVARQTEAVYYAALNCERLSFLQRMMRYLTVGWIACVAALWIQAWAKVVDLIFPKHQIDIVPDLVSMNRKK